MLLKVHAFISFLLLMYGILCLIWGDSIIISLLIIVLNVYLFSWLIFKPYRYLELWYTDLYSIWFKYPSFIREQKKLLNDFDFVNKTYGTYFDLNKLKDLTLTDLKDLHGDLHGYIQRKKNSRI